MYRKWPHEVAALPFHLFLAYREEWIARNVAAAKATEEASASDDDVIEFNAETFTERSAK